MPNTTLEEEL